MAPLVKMVSVAYRVLEALLYVDGQEYLSFFGWSVGLLVLTSWALSIRFLDG